MELNSFNGVEALESGQTREAKNVGACRLQACVNTEFLRDFVKAAIGRATRLRECLLRELQLYIN